MQEKTNKNQLMASWKKKWGADAGLKRKVSGIVGSANKLPQVEHLVSEYSNLSRIQIEKKMREMKLSPVERKKLIEMNDELSRVFGIEKKGTKSLTKQGKRRLRKKEEMHKKFNIRSGRDTASNIKNKKKNRLDGVYKKKAGSAKDYGYANVEEEGHHKATALGGAHGASSITKTSNDSVVAGGGATGLTGGAPGGISKGGRPIGLK